MPVRSVAWNASVMLTRDVTSMGEFITGIPSASLTTGEFPVTGATLLPHGESLMLFNLILTHLVTLRFLTRDIFDRPHYCLFHLGNRQRQLPGLTYLVACLDV